MEAHRLLHKMQTSAARVDYTINNLFMDKVNKQADEALAQLAEATYSNRSAVADLALANVQLMEQVANMSTKMSTKDIVIATLRNSIKKLT
eukprot:1800285-Ditylum_brightwellii.AAC.1